MANAVEEAAVVGWVYHTLGSCMGLGAVCRRRARCHGRGLVCLLDKIREPFVRAPRSRRHPLRSRKTPAECSQRMAPSYP